MCYNYSIKGKGLSNERKPVMKKRLLSLVLCAVMVLTCVPFALSVSAAEGTPKNDNVVYVADNGKDNGTGTTPTDPVNDFSIAMEKLAKTGRAEVSSRKKFHAPLVSPRKVSTYRAM